MKDIFDLFLASDIASKVFIISSVGILGIIYRITFRFKLLLISLGLFIGIQFLFGLLLSRISEYNLLVHVVLYILPSLVVYGLLLLFKKQKKGIDKEYSWTLKTESGKIEIYNPFEGIGIFAGAGGGKTRSLIMPMIKEMAKKDFAGIVYSFKEFQLTECAYTHYLDSEVDFKHVCLFDPRYSDQVNPISPKYITSSTHAEEAARILQLNLDEASQGSKGDPFWTKAPLGILSGIIWRLVKDFPERAYLPYVIAIVMEKDLKELIGFLKGNKESELLASSFLKVAETKESVKTAANLLSVFCSTLSMIAKPEIFYVLSGDNIPMDLNNPASPTLLCLSTKGQLKRSFSPIIGLIEWMCIQNMQAFNRQHSAIVMDEATTIKLPDFDEIPAVVREFKIATVFCIQDMVQAEKVYGPLVKEGIMANLGHQFYGKVRNPKQAKYYSEMFGQIEKEYKTKTRKAGAVSNNSYSMSLRSVDKYRPQTFVNLNRGEFFGVLDTANISEFGTKFALYNEEHIELPRLNDVTEQEVQDNFIRILAEAKEL